MVINCNKWSDKGASDFFLLGSKEQLETENYFSQTGHSVSYLHRLLIYRWVLNHLPPPVWIGLFLPFFNGDVLSATRQADKVLKEFPSGDGVAPCPRQIYFLQLTYPMHCSVSLLSEQKLLSHVFLALTGSRDAVLNVTIIIHPAVPFLWCNRVRGKTLNRTAVVGG